MAIKVLVVDDSALMRKKIASILTVEQGFMVETANDGVEAIRLNQSFQPDVVTLDVNMPKIDGISALAEMMLTRPVPVVMLSSLTAKGALATFEAMALGAVDFLTKPDGTISLAIHELENELLTKVRNAAKAKIRSSKVEPQKHEKKKTGIRDTQEERFQWQKIEMPKPRASEQTTKSSIQPDEPEGVVLIGVSTGGPGTLEMILTQLPADFPYPVVIAQHMPAAFTGAFAGRLNQLCALDVVEVQKLSKVTVGKVYVARGDADMVFTTRNGQLYLQPKPADPSFRWHPSVELLGRSALECCHGEGLIAVMLTGMGNDGAESFAQIYQAGGKTIAESEDSAVVWGMPKELIEKRGATLVLPAAKIAAQLQHWVHR